MKKSSTIINFLWVLFFLVFIYILAVLNLYKISKTIEFNIFKSDGLFQLGIYAVIGIPLVFIIERMWAKHKDKFMKIK